MQGASRTAICYTVFGDWSDELEWEFLRLVGHVSRSPLMHNYDIILLWETMDNEALPANPPTASTTLMTLLAENSRVRFFHATVEQAATAYPRQAFQHGFYYNPEVALMLFQRQSSLVYSYYWLVEADVRWTVRGVSRFRGR